MNWPFNYHLVCIDIFYTNFWKTTLRDCDTQNYFVIEWSLPCWVQKIFFLLISYFFVDSHSHSSKNRLVGLNRNLQTRNPTLVHVVVVYHVTIVTIGHGLLKKFWPLLLGCVLRTAGSSIILNYADPLTSLEQLIVRIWNDFFQPQTLI